jgi:hypothetical protein
MTKEPQDDNHDCDQQSRHNDQPLYQRLALVGKKSSNDITFYAQLMSEHAEDLWYKLCATVYLSCPCHKRAKPNVTSNATINDIAIDCTETPMPLNDHNNCDCHNNCYVSTHTQNPLHLNRLQQATMRLTLTVTACGTMPMNASDAT